MEKIKETFIKFLSLIRKPEMKVLPGHLAFSLVLSIVSLLVMIGYIASLFNISISSAISFINSSFPKEVSELLVPLINGKNIDMNIFLFMIVGFFIASNGTHSIIVASNTLYNMKDSDYVKERVKALFMTILLVFLFFFIIVVLAFGNYIVKYILELKMLEGISSQLYYIFAFMKWPIAFIILFFSIKILYTIAPDQSIKSKYVNRGSFFTTIAWIIITAIYSYYVGNIAHYNIFYGALSNIIVLMIWVYLIAYVFVIGIAINATCYKLPQKAMDNNLE